MPGVSGTRTPLARGAQLVWERDNGVCSVCLDLAVNVARGGEHSYRNARVTHPSCNLRKG